MSILFEFFLLKRNLKPGICERKRRGKNKENIKSMLCHFQVMYLGAKPLGQLSFLPTDTNDFKTRIKEQISLREWELGARINHPEGVA
jgi:hypothetical protein